MPFWTRKLAEGKSLLTVTPSQNRTLSHFLQLPGEIRILIYSYAIYPRLDSVFVAHGEKKPHFGKTTLNVGLFRVSHQVRAEALSYLCSTKHLEVFSIKAANAFFECIGSAIGEAKRLTIAQPVVHDKPMALSDIDLFLHFLGRATSLQFFRLELGHVKSPFEWEEREANVDDLAFLEKIRAFVKKRKEVEFRWSAGAYDSRAPTHGSVAARSRSIRELLGKDYEDWSQRSVLYLW